MQERLTANSALMSIGGNGIDANNAITRRGVSLAHPNTSGCDVSMQDTNIICELCAWGIIAIH